MAMRLCTLFVPQQHTYCGNKAGHIRYDLYLRQGGAFGRKDQHHRDVLSTVWHFKDLNFIFIELSILEFCFLIHHRHFAGFFISNIKVIFHNVLLVEFVSPLALKCNT